MQYRRLGQTALEVSLICLGTMTWGEQNTEAEAHAQMDYALEQGVNFFDVAELYPVPPKPDTQGRTEEHIGTWFKARNNRDKVILATKAAGKEPQLTWIRDGGRCFNAKHLNAAVETSLKRLQTDYIDLYQLHWPDRETNNFGTLGYTHKPQDTEWPGFDEVLDALQALIQSGKIRHIGVSNETPWGLSQFLKLAETKGYPRMVSIQNPYSLLNRSFEVGLAEMAIREQCGLLAYSPLGFGMLTGKYENGAKPKGARITEFERFRRYSNPQGVAATTEYVQLAQQHGLSPAQMALAFVNQQPFVTSNIIGATTLEQLKENIDSAQLTLSDALLQEIEAIHARYTYPCP